MLVTLNKTMRMSGRLVHSYISTMKIHNSCVTCAGHQVLPPLNKDEELRVLETVNKSTLEELQAFDIKPNHMKKIEAFREKNGKFETFNDILLSQDIPMVVKLCRSILIGEKKTRKQKSSGEQKSVVTPTLDVLMKKNIKKILAIRVWGDRISWAMIDQYRNLCEWDSSIWENPSKSSLVPLVNVIIDIISELPDADAYIMESDSHTSFTKLNTASFGFHLQRQQVIAIIISVLQLKQRAIHGTNGTTNNLYLLQAHAAAKRFNLRVGSETVSSELLMDDILTDTPRPDNELSILIKPEKRLQYTSKGRDIREQLNAVLLIAMTFMELVNDKGPVKA